MKRLLMFGACLLWAPAVSAQVPVPSVCESVYLPELAPPEGVPTTTIAHTFRVGPGSERPDVNGQPYPLFYPFDLFSTRDAGDSWTVTVTQQVGHPYARFRRWRNVQSVSLISLFGYVLPYYTDQHGWYYVDASGQWRAGGMTGGGEGTFNPYQTMPHTAPAGVVPSWAYRYDRRPWGPCVDTALSDRLVRYAGWNVGIYAPHGIWEVGMQVKALICGERQP